jgi:hypothetical protein
MDLQVFIILYTTSMREAVYVLQFVHYIRHSSLCSVPFVPRTWLQIMMLHAHQPRCFTYLHMPMQAVYSGDVGHVDLREYVLVVCVV